MIVSEGDYYVNMNSTPQNRINKLKYNLKHLPKTSYIYIILSIIQMLFQFVIVLCNMIFNGALSKSYSSVVFNVALLFGAIIIAYSCLDAVFTENEFQLISFFLMTIVFFIATIANGVWKLVALIQSDDLHEKGPGLWTIISFIGLMISIVGVTICQITFSILIKKVFKSFGWKMFNLVGGNKALGKMYRIFTIFKTMLKFDSLISLIVIFLSFMLQSTGPTGDPFYVLIIIYVSLTVILIVQLGMFHVFIWFGVKKELRVVHIFMTIMMLLLPIYLIIKWGFSIYRILTPNSDAYGNPFLSKCNVKSAECSWGIDEEFTSVVMSLLTVICVFLRIILIGLSILVFFNFNKGLKNIFRRENKLYSDKVKEQSLNDIEKIFARTMARNQDGLRGSDTEDSEDELSDVILDESMSSEGTGGDSD